tara:strand:- start:59 stop:2272 length:2214 start_codon:yes stop_codon:yes gene_type:complete
MSWQLILKDRAKVMSPKMKLVYPLLGYNKSEMNNAVSDFYDKHIHTGKPPVPSDKMTEPKFQEILTILHKKLLAPPEVDYFKEPPISISHVKLPMKEFSKYREKIKWIIELKNMHSNHNHSIIMELYNNDIEKLIEYLTGKVSYNKHIFQNKKKLVTKKRVLAEDAITQRQKILGRLINNNKIDKKKIIEKLKSNPEILGYEIKDGTMILMEIEGKVADAIKIKAEKLDLDIDTPKPVLYDKINETYTIGGKPLESKFTHIDWSIFGFDNVNPSPSGSKSKTERAYGNKERSLFAFTGFPKFMTKEQLFIFSNGTTNNYNAIKRTKLAQILKFAEYVDFDSSERSSRKKASKKRTEELTRTTGRRKNEIEQSSTKLSIEYFLQAILARKKSDKMQMLQGTSKSFRLLVDDYATYKYMFDIYFNHENKEQLEPLLNEMLTEVKSKIKTSKLLIKLKSYFDKKETKQLKKDTKIDDDLLDELQNKHNNYNSNTWNLMATILPVDRHVDNESELRFKTGVKKLLNKLEDSYLGATLTSNQREGLLLFEVEVDDETENKIETLTGLEFFDIGEAIERMMDINKFKTILNNMVKTHIDFETQNNADKITLQKFKKMVFNTEDEEITTSPEVEIIEYNVSRNFGKFIIFSKGLDRTLNGNKELSESWRNLDKNKNEKIDADESEETPISNMRDLLLDRYEDVRKSLLNEISESIKYVINEDVVLDGNPKFQPVTWLTEVGIRG